MELEDYFSNNNYTIIDGIYVFNNLRAKEVKQNRINVLEELGKGIIWKNVYAHYYRFLFIMKSLKNNSVLLDLGCGRGWLIDLIYRNKYKVSYIGVDLSLNSLKYARKKRHKYPAYLIQSNCTNLPLVDSFSDYIVCLEVIEHNNKQNAEKIINKCKSMLKPGGYLFISTPNKKGHQMVFPQDHIYEWGLDEFTTLLTQIGFNIKQTFGCFGKKEEIVSALSIEEKIIYEKLSSFFSWHVLSPFFSALHARESQGFIILCQKPLSSIEVICPLK